MPIETGSGSAVVERPCRQYDDW